ncbi:MULTISPECIES: hypothetical protein [unclassified Streptomyces]|uniref:hypothetical protein n=1 Tax=unclassified Streptomyces TaxID=2593676 RepID=UPI002251A42D|nr:MULTISPECIES: hypothetical protein [unclassified Streptomyces]MCX4526621.1 hypothetical protein [Streptomyces sp. NBC_01551]MCX4542816.1 hypothetical protein [Streptomyces sp. NBC_01565]
MDPHSKAQLIPPLAPLPLPRTHAEPGQQAPPPTGHTTSTAERGSFCLAVCTCGWKGPARRSRDLARQDATRHTAG